MSSAPSSGDQPSAHAELFLQCLDTAPADREAVLEALCRQHPEQAVVLRRLHAALDEFRLVDEPVVAALKAIGDYVVCDVVGSGGMGLVYLAEHRTLRRRVALKVIHEGLARTPKARERFRREALAASRLDHPGICPVYDVGIAEEMPYIAMRLVPGHTLAWHIVRSQGAGHASVWLPVGADAVPGINAVVHLIERAAAALHAAHEAGLVHRDVKPGNLMVTPDGEPVLLDFGLARVDDDVQPTLTVAGDRLGTPVYMAPELIAGGAVDRRTDVYALGVVLYECLTLRPPFDAVSRESLYRQILRVEAPNARRLNPAIGRDLWTVLQTAMAKEPQRRYATAQAFAEDLRRVRQHETIRARRASWSLRLQRFAQRNPVAAGFVTFLLIAVLAFAVLLRQRGAALADKETALRTARANEQALQARAHGAASPPRALAAALQAVEAAENVETRSALFAAVVECRERVRLRHDASVWKAVFAPDGARVLTCSDDRTARLWDVDGRELKALSHDGPVTEAVFSPDGRYIATGAFDGTVKVWTGDGSLLWTLDHGAERRLQHPLTGTMLRPSVVVAMFDPTSRLLATSCDDGHVRLWSVVDGQPIGQPLGAKQFKCIAWSADGRLFATADGDLNPLRSRSDRFEVVVYDLGSGAPQPRWRSSQAMPIECIEFAADGPHLLCCSYDPAHGCWISDLEAGTERVLPHEGGVAFAYFSPDSQRILTSGSDGIVRLWSREGQLRHVWSAGTMAGAVFCGNERIATFAREHNTVRLHDSALNELLVLRGHDDYIGAPAISPDGRLLASCSWDRTARLWDLVIPDLPRLLGHRGSVHGLVELADGRMTSVGHDGTLRVWDAATAAATVHTIHQFPRGMVLSPDGGEVLVTHEDAIVRRYHLATGKKVAEYPDPADKDTAALFLGDGRVLVSGRRSELIAHSIDGRRSVFGSRTDRTCALARAPRAGLVAGSGWMPTITLWREDGTRLAEWPAHAVWVDALAFSPDERWLASGGNDRTVRVWDLSDPSTPRLAHAPLGGHDGALRALAWSHDGRLLASGGSDGSVHLWHSGTWELIAVLRGHRGSVNAVLFATGDARLFTAGDDGAIQSWPTSVSELRDIARRRLATLGDESAPRSTDTLGQLHFLLRFGDADAARALGARLVESAIRARQPVLLNRLAWGIVDPAQSWPHLDLDLAERAASQAVELTHGSNAGFLATLARVWFLRGDVRRAMELQQRAVAASEKNGSGRLGNLRQVLAEYERLVEALPR